MVRQSVFMAVGVIWLGLLIAVYGFPERVKDDHYMHNRGKRSVASDDLMNIIEAERSANFWNAGAQISLREHLNKRLNTDKAKNIILFVGDGMSIPTVAAARAYLGQLHGHSGEESRLSFEEFPFTGLSKTYCVNKQVADSACSATAYLCGVKANEGTLGVTANVLRRDCKAMANSSNHVDSIARWAQQANKATGIVTTTRITHASPAGTYAHTANRDWESDYHVRNDGWDPKMCPDIAHQLIHSEPGKSFKVILGGGRKEFIPKYTIDEEGDPGYREDGRNLIEEWQKMKKDAGVNYKYVWNRTELFSAVKNDKVDYLLGLFDNDHCPYQLDANPETEASLSEMTQAALEILSREKNGYFLFVEGGRIDHAHHDTMAHKALEETVQLAEAVRVASEMTNPAETLIVVTSDHAHTMAYAGYPQRGNNILSVAGRDKDRLPYPTLSYANGPGYRPIQKDGKRHNLHEDDMKHKDYKFPALAPLDSETHGGDDVAIFARGPWAHLLTGVIEQNVIPHVLAYASCIGNGLTVCHLQQGL